METNGCWFADSCARCPFNFINGADAIQKEVIVSNIYPYRKLEEVFHLKMELVELKSSNIMSKMEGIIAGNKTKGSELMKRSKVICDNFNFEKNTEITVKYFLN